MLSEHHVICWLMSIISSFCVEYTFLSNCKLQAADQSAVQEELQQMQDKPGIEACAASQDKNMPDGMIIGEPL